jgi:ABC-type antimicrobial peptide transport system permease subunit
VPVGEDFVYLVGIDMDALEAGETMRWHEGSWNHAEPKLRARKGVLVSDNFAGLNGLRLGDRFTLPGWEGPYKVEVAGIVTDYSWSRGTILADRSLLEENHGISTLDIVVLYVKPGVAVDEVRSAILSRFGASHDLHAGTSQGFKEMVIDELSAFFSFAGAQQFVVLFIAFLAVLNTVTLSVMARRTEIAYLSAVGATPGQLRGLAVFEGAVLAVLGTALGLVVGASVSAILMRDLLFAVSGWRLPVTLPWDAINLLFLGSVLLGVIAGLFGMRLARAPGVVREEG